MIRPTTPGDSEALIPLAESTQVFKPAEIQGLREVLADYFSTHQAHGHRCITLEEHGQVLGFLYYAPAAMTDRTWIVWWIVVHKESQGRGLGKALLDHAEDDMRKRGARLITVETSSLPKYDLTRRFYLKHGYAVAARVPDFYAEGDDLLTFRKHL